MEKDNKKVNNAENTNAKKAESLGEISDGFYDLPEGYSKPKAKSTSITREEYLRRKDEKRRALEMQAIKEDIERRYSLHLENAQSKVYSEFKTEDSQNSKVKTDESEIHETVKEELERIDEIIASEAVADSKISEKIEAETKEEFSKKAIKEEPEFNVDDENFIYAIFYRFGDTICHVLKIVFLVLSAIIKKPVLLLIKSISKATDKTKRKTVSSIKSTVKEIVYFKKEISRASKSIAQAFKKPLTLPSVLLNYIKLSLLRHNKLLKSASNILLPVISLGIFLLTLNYWSNVTFALEVVYNEKSIGYISDESVYIEAKSLVKDRLSSGAYSSDTANVNVTEAETPNLNATYNLSIVSIEELNDAQAISDRIIENSVDNLTHACGIYIDGEFICAVKNESDAKTVFYDILEPYEADAEENGYVIGFAETIDYIQGLYRDDKDVMWDAAQLSSVLNGGQTPEETYVAGENETLKTVIENTGVSEETLRLLNPSVDWDNLQNGDEIVTEGGESLINIRKIVTTTSVRDIKYDTVKKRDSSKYSGYRKVIQSGVNGSERVTKTQIYINGELQDTEYSYETLTEPVDEIVTVGTKTSYGGVYIGEASDSGFLWPAPSCHRVSSPYGWRSSGWHNGIDLIKSGGGALGTPVIASKSGRVEVVQRSNSGYGNMVLINHGNGYKTRYAHMISGSITVSVGDYVDAGQTIGKVGSTGNSTGPHLHFEVIYQGETQNPKNYIY